MFQENLIDQIMRFYIVTQRQSTSTIPRHLSQLRFHRPTITCQHRVWTVPRL